MKRKWYKKRSKKTGLPPGELIFVGESKVEHCDLTLIEYDEEFFREEKISADLLPQIKESRRISWLNIDGLDDLQLIRKMGDTFGFHDLLLEDILNTDQSPKVDFFEGCIFFVLRMLTFDQGREEIQSEQISFIFKDQSVFSFQEKPGDLFQPIRERLKNKKGRIRSKKADYLLSTLLDATIDHYFVLLEELGEKIESLEERLVKDISDETLKKIHHIKREIIFLQKSIRPIRGLLQDLFEEESSLICQDTEKYFHDVYDHTNQIDERIETYRELAAHLLDIYMSGVSNRMNQVMKLLTVVATLFIPLTFIVGIYGMNFEFMPELKWKWGYPLVLCFVAVLGVGSFIYLKKKKWF